jgi:hypothetical protein
MGQTKKMILVALVTRIISMHRFSGFLVAACDRFLELLAYGMSGPNGSNLLLFCEIRHCPQGLDIRERGRYVVSLQLSNNFSDGIECGRAGRLKGLLQSLCYLVSGERFRDVSPSARKGNEEKQGKYYIFDSQAAHFCFYVLGIRSAFIAVASAPGVPLYNSDSRCPHSGASA